MQSVYLPCWVLLNLKSSITAIFVWRGGQSSSVWYHWSGQHDIVLANSKLLSQYKCHGEDQVLQHHLETLHHWLAVIFGWIFMMIRIILRCHNTRTHGSPGLHNTSFTNFQGINHQDQINDLQKVLRVFVHTCRDYEIQYLNKPFPPNSHSGQCFSAQWKTSKNQYTVFYILEFRC